MAKSDLDAEWLLSVKGSKYEHADLVHKELSIVHKLNVL